MKNQIKKEKTDKISYVVFILALIIVVLNLVSLFFPALLMTLATGTTGAVDPFEIGPLALPVLVIDAVIFYLMYLYLKKKLPKKFQNSIEFIGNFEVSRKVTIIVIVILLGGYVIFAAGDLSNYEGDQWRDFEKMQESIKKAEARQFQSDTPGLPTLFIVKYLLLISSEEVFQNVKVIPFLGSISLLLVTYFLTVEISKKRFAGIIAMIILLQSYIFQLYDTMATYTNFWTLFYVLSLYMLYKRWPLSPVAYVLSLFSKALTAVYLPLTLFFIYKLQMPKKKKIYVMISYVAIGIILAAVVATIMSPHSFEFNNSDFWSGFTTLAFQMRSDVLILTFLLPLTVALFLTSRRGIPEADSILVLIMGILFLVPILLGFSAYTMHPYRYMPLIVFFAVGVGTLLSKKITQLA